MDRNPNDGLGGKSYGEGATGSSGSSGFGASGAGASGNLGTGTPGVSGGSTGGYGSQGGSGAGLADRAESKGEELKDRAKDAANSAKDKAREGWDKTSEKAGEWKMALADKLEDGARRLRREKSSVSELGVDGSGVARQADDRLDNVANSVAGGMENSARWLREHDLEGVKADIETQVRENPARSLLIAVGVGYLIGKAFRR